MAMYYGDSNGKAQRIVVTGMQGPAGPQGPQGATGPQGPAGQGVPAGGTAGQVLTKASGNDYDTEWADLENWEEVTAFSNQYYKLYACGSIRILQPIANYSLSLSAVQTASITNVWGIDPVNDIIGTVPYGHKPANDVSIGTGNISYMDGTKLTKIYSINIIVDRSMGYITLNVSGLAFSNNSTAYVTEELPSIVYSV